MALTKAILKWLSVVFLVFYVVPCALLYFNQEKIIFHPEHLHRNHTFSFDQKFREKDLTAADGSVLNGVLFKADSVRGLIFYLHGNAGSIQSWGSVARTYTSFGYDVFLPDYRGYGKSEATITSEDQLYRDVQLFYDDLKKTYRENNIIILGYSIGTGPAAELASRNKARLLILQAPYYSASDMMKRSYPFVPTFLLKYKFAINEHLKDCAMPVVIFHGEDDEVIPFSSSQRLKAEFENKITLINLPGQRHNGMTDNPDYRKEIEKILSE